MGVIRHEKENAQKGRANTQAFSLFSQICIDEITIWPMAAASPQPTAGASPRLPPTGGASPRQPPCGAALPLPLRWHLALPAVWWQNHCQLSITTHSSPFFHGHYQKKGCKTFGVGKLSWCLATRGRLVTCYLFCAGVSVPTPSNDKCTLHTRTCPTIARGASWPTWLAAFYDLSLKERARESKRLPRDLAGQSASSPLSYVPTYKTN